MQKAISQCFMTKYKIFVCNNNSILQANLTWVFIHGTMSSHFSELMMDIVVALNVFVATLYSQAACEK